MSELTPDDVDRVARMARLELTETERRELVGQLGAILEYADRLATVDTAGITPGSQTPSLRMVERSDHPLPGLQPAETLGNAPAADRASGLFRVPRVIGG
jgi:aspartyl-tRNA(Asn)/glutamyl-tRNA(Gln) amidotransferase subunit C